MAGSRLTYPSHLRGQSLHLARGAPVIAGQWDVIVESALLGSGPAVFAETFERLRSWQMHRDAGLTVEVSGEQSEQIRIRVGRGRLAMSATCLVVGRVEQERESGFAYGTTAQHPERREEAFMVRWLDDDRVVGSVAAFSQPAVWYARLGGPLTRFVQRQMAKRYLRALISS
jgi:uncharacterized protein (UPF0548 family)